MKVKILAIVLLALGVTRYANGQQIREYIGEENRAEVALDVKALPDGGAVIVGYSTELPAGSTFDYTTSDALIVRVNSWGGVVWSRRLGVDQLEDKFYKVVVGSNGDYYTVGVVGHSPWHTVSATPGVAAIYRFDDATGIHISSFIDDPSNQSFDKGSMYEDLVELANGDFVAVGARDCRPTWSDGMATCFNSTLGVVWNTVFNITNTDALISVANDGNRIFVGGNYIGNTMYDLNIAELDPTNGNIIWERGYPFSATRSTVNLTCNWMYDMQFENNELMVMVGVSNDYLATTNLTAGILRVDPNNGSVNALSMFDHPGFSHTNIAAVDYYSNTQAYYIINPANSLMTVEAPLTPALSVADAILSDLDPVNGTVNDVKLLIHTGEQAIASVNLSGSDSYYAGTGLNDQPGTQIGQHDIFYVKNNGGLPDDYSNCVSDPDNLDYENIQFSDVPTTTQELHNYTSFAPSIDEYNPELSVSLACDRGERKGATNTLNIASQQYENTLVNGEIYPNPAGGQITIPVITQSGGDVTVRIIRMDGVVVYDAKEAVEKGQQVLKINLGNLVPGNYMCEIRNNEVRNTRVFTKQ